jgi:hypothetical protein
MNPRIRNLLLWIAVAVAIVVLFNLGHHHHA